MGNSAVGRQMPLAVDELAAAWMACPPAAQSAWLSEHGALLNLAVLECLKQQSDRALRDDAQIAERVTASMLRMAEEMSDEPLALPLAWWARGNAFSFTNPQQAVACYERALTIYRQLGARGPVLTLISNLLYVQSEIDLTAAEQVYATALEEWRQFGADADYPTLRRIEQNGGILLRRLGRYDEALLAHRRALALAEQLGQLERIPEILGNIALTLGDMGRFQECESHFLQSRTAAVAAGNWLTAARMEMNLGELFNILGRPADALAAFAQAHTQFAALNNPMELASVALREAHLFERLGALIQANRRYRLAKEYFRSLQMWPQVWQATLEGAKTQRRYGAYQQAARLLAEAETLFTHKTQAVWQSEWRLEAAALALAQQDFAAAQQFLAAWQDETPPQLQTPRLRTHYHLLCGELWERMAANSIAPSPQPAQAQRAYEQVLTFAEQQGELRLKRQALAGLGRLSRGQELRRARSLLLEAAEQDTLIRADLSVQELKADFLHQSSDVLEQLFVWAFEDKNHADALVYSWRAKGMALLELLAAQQMKPHPSAPLLHTGVYPTDPLLTQIQELRHRLMIMQWQASQEANRQNRLQGADESASAAMAQLEQQLIDLRRQRNQQRRDTTRLDAQIMRELCTTINGDLIIEYMQAQGQLYATVLEPGGATATIHLAAVNDVLDLLDELTLHFRTLLTLSPPYRRQPGLIAECRALLAHGYDWLIRPLPMPAAAKQLIIAPCSPLHRIPFAALWDGAAYLCERYQLELTPTAALFSLSPPTLPLTNPLVITDSAEGMLLANRRQGEAIRQLYPHAVCLGDDPNALTYLQNLSVAPLFLHIAAHTVEREDAPLFTAMQLTQAMLTVEQSYELPLHGTQLVTLSSCVTNSGMDSAGALLAFQSAFFAAGAQRVLSTLWEIQSEVTEEWMATFYRHLQTGLLPPVALRRTQLEFSQHQEFSHPVYWAAFACSRR